MKGQILWVSGKGLRQEEGQVKWLYNENMLGFLKEQQGGQCGWCRVSRQGSGGKSMSVSQSLTVVSGSSPTNSPLTPAGWTLP